MIKYTTLGGSVPCTQCRVAVGAYGFFSFLPKSAGTDMHASMKEHEPRKFKGAGSSTPSSKSTNIIKAGGSISAKKRYFLRV